MQYGVGSKRLRLSNTKATLLHFEITVDVSSDVEFLTVAPERIGFFAVLGVVAYKQVLLRHAQGHDEADGKHNQGGHHDIPAYDECRANDLL